MKTIFFRQKNVFIFICTILLLGGCASTGAIHTTMPITVKLSNFKTVLLYVSSQVPESSQEIVQIESMTIAKLREKDLFEKVIAGSASPDAQVDLRLSAKIMKLKKVGAGSRAMLGALAGRGGVVINVELTDMNTGKTISTFEAEGKSSGGTVFAGTTDQAIEQATDQIVEFVKKNM